jgi:hypothetical protein
VPGPDRDPPACLWDIRCNNRHFTRFDPFFDALLKKGLHARLQSASLIIGQQNVALDFSADEPAAEVSMDGPDYVVPATEGARFPHANLDFSRMYTMLPALAAGRADSSFRLAKRNRGSRYMLTRNFIFPRRLDQTPGSGILVGIFVMLITHVRNLLKSPPLAFSRPVAAGLMRVSSSKLRASINPKGSLIAIGVSDLTGGIENQSGPTQRATVDLRRRPVV